MGKMLYGAYEMEGYTEDGLESERGANLLSAIFFFPFYSVTGII